MNGLGRDARRILELGRDVGEPDEASIQRGRARVMMRVGGTTAGLAAIAAISTTARAAPLAVAPAAAPAIAMTTAAGAVRTASFLLTPLLTKVGATVVLVAALGTGAIVHQVQVCRGQADLAQRPANAIAASDTQKERRAFPAQAASTERNGAVAPESGIAIAQPGSRAGERTEPVSPAGPAPVVPPSPPRSADAIASAAHAPAVTPGATQGLTQDVANLRAAQGALVSGHPQEALDAAEQVRSAGPLSEERDTIRILAQCALGSPGAREDAQRFVASRSQSPLALRVQTACLTSK